MLKKILSYIKYFLIYTIIILYSLELLTIMFLGKKYNFATENFDQLFFEQTSKIEGFDRRTGVKAFVEEKQKNSNLTPNFRFAPWHLLEHEYGKKVETFIKNKIENKEIIPFKGPMNKQTLGSAEDGKRRTINNDKFGYKNPNSVYDKEIDLMIIGDSFAEGVPFSEQDDIAGRIRKKSNLNAINFGISGAGPLLSLAVLSEYGQFFTPKKVYYLFFEGNDMDDLVNEKKTFLINYLGNYSQNLYEKEKEVENFLNEYQDLIYQILPYLSTSEKKPKPSENKFSENFKDFLELSAIKDILFPKSLHSFKEEEDPELMLETLRKMKKISQGWDGEINFVYVPSWHRYNQKYSFANYIYKKKIENLVLSSDLNFIDLVKIFNTEDIVPLEIYNFGQHFNNKGYGIISKTIIEHYKK